MKARDVMTAHPSVVTPDDTIRTAAQVMRDRHVGTLPVIDNLRDRQLKGIITDRDIVIRCLAAGHGADCTVKEHMTSRHLTTARLDDEVSEVAHESFDGALVVVRSFFATIDVSYEGQVLVPGMEKKGDIAKRPEALAEALALGRKLAG